MKITALGLLGLLWAAGKVPGALEVAAPQPVAAATSTRTVSVAAVVKPETGEAPSRPAADGDLLKFSNGDALHGTLVSVEADGALRWRRTDIKDPVSFNPDNVLELQLAPRPPRTPRTPHRQVVELTNGDRLAGDVMALNDKVLKLDTWYAGRLELKRAMVQRIACRAAQPEAVYAGPTGLTGWTAAEGPRNSWKYKGGAFYSPLRSGGGLGRNVNLPDMANIEFDLVWHGPLYFQVGFYYSNLSNLYSSGGYMLQMNGTSVYLNRTSPNRGSNNMGSSVEIPKFQNKSKTRASIRVNKAKKTIALFLDQELVKQWTDTEEFVGSGKGLIFASQGQGQFRVSNIVVTQWDGRLEGEAAGVAPSGDDLVRFANGDKVSGMVKSIAKDEAVLTTSFSEMKVPLERIVLIELAGQKAGMARRQAGDVRASFLDGSRFTLTLEKMNDQVLAGSTENCGRVTTAFDAFSRVQFHIYAPRPKADGDDDWGGVIGGDNTEGVD
ncbi:MAG: hypothetical protein NTV49_11355 [Kiritimatiellaeota bacterium]|nr:hypothetical protein [Kiritimatiellota bacterium]